MIDFPGGPIERDDGLRERFISVAREYAALLNRYDDALRRINDLQAENDAMRMELARKP